MVAREEVSPTPDPKEPGLDGDSSAELEALRARLVETEEEVSALRRRLQDRAASGAPSRRRAAA